MQYTTNTPRGKYGGSDSSAEVPFSQVTLVCAKLRITDQVFVLIDSSALSKGSALCRGQEAVVAESVRFIIR